MMPVNTLNAAIIGAGALIATAMGWSGIKDLRAAPEPAGMRLIELRYEDGLFYQEHLVYGAETIRAEWAAKIVRGDRFLCVGGGTSAYENGGSPLMTPSYWTGGECPEVQPGDIATATWEYVDENNVRRRIGAEITIE